MQAKTRKCCKCGCDITDKDTIGINRNLLGAHTVKFMCVKHLAEFFGTGEHVLRAKIEELNENNCPLFR